MKQELLRLLFLDSQQQDAEEADLDEIFEKLAGVEKLEVNRKGLEKAVRKLGVEGGEFAVAEGDVITLKFDDVSAFRDAVVKLTDVNKMVELAEMGWFAVAEGDVAGQAEPVGELRINFISTAEAEMADDTPKTGEMPTKAADQMNEPGTEDLTGTKARRRGLPKGIGKDAAQFEALDESDRRIGDLLYSAFKEGGKWHAQVLRMPEESMVHHRWGLSSQAEAMQMLAEWQKLLGGGERLSPRSDTSEAIQPGTLTFEQATALIQSGRSTCPTSNGHDLDVWERARDAVSHYDKTTGVRHHGARVEPPALESIDWSNVTVLSEAAPAAQQFGRRGEDTWRARVQDIFASLGELERYDREYGVAEKAGCSTAKELWDRNPVLRGLAEARVGSSHVAMAFATGRRASEANTMTDGTAFFLHGNKIAERRADHLWISLAGWNTPTTRERLNAVLDAFQLPARVYNTGGTRGDHRSGRAFVRRTDGGEPEQQELPADEWFDVGRISSVQAISGEHSEIPEHVEAEAKRIVDRLLEGPNSVPLPAGPAAPAGGKIKIVDFEFEDDGVQHEQYWPGVSTLSNNGHFNHVVTGIGEDPASAFEDMLETVAQQVDGEVDFSAIEEAGGEYAESHEPSVSDVLASQLRGGHEDEADTIEHHYFLSIRYNLPGEGKED